MKISIIIPCYNAEKYLRDTVASLLKQTYTDWEAICIDDGSKDSTGRILQEFAQTDDRINVYSQSNAGVSAARNKALGKCSGDYICFIDSDDTIEPDYLERLLGMYSSGTDMAVCGFTRQMCPISPNEKTHEMYRFSADECIRKILLDKSFHPQICCMLFRKRIIAENRLEFTPGCARGEDWEFFMKYLVHGSNVTYSPVPLYHYRINDTSAMSSFNEKSLTSLDASERVAEYFDCHESPLKDIVKQYAVPRTLWKFLILSLLRHDREMYFKLKSRYDAKAELRKMFSYPGYIEKITSRLFVCCEPLFKSAVWISGFLYK